MASLSIRVNLQGVRLVDPKVDLITGLMRSSLLPWVPVAINSSSLLPVIASEAPISHDVVEWMHIAASDNAVFDMMCNDYNRSGSDLVSASGDPYIPGVRAGDIRGESVSGYTVRSRGYGTVITPRGSFNVPIRGKATFAKGDILAWAAIPDPGTGVQWVLTLLQWRDLARAPINNRIRFASSHGLVAPNFISIPSTLAPIRTLIIGITSNKEQKVVIRGRGTKGYYENILFDDSFNIGEGKNEVIYNVFGLPSVGAFTLELQPQDNTETILDYINLLPPI